MQSGGALKISRFGYVVLLAAACTTLLPAQTTQSAYGTPCDPNTGYTSSGSPCTSPNGVQANDQSGMQASPLSGLYGNAPQSSGSTSRGVVLQGGPAYVQQPRYGQSNLNDLNGQTGTYAYPYGNYSSPTGLNRWGGVPAAPQTEFQHMVQDSIGRALPIYGANLFQNVPSTFAPVDDAPVTPNYVVGPGDELLVQAWGQVTLDGRFRVDRAGNIYLPQVGTVHVAGVEYSQLQSYLHSQMGKVFRNFDLNVNMGQLRSIQIFVVGQARRPGSYVVSSLSTLVNALFATGGPTPQGSLRHIELKRKGKIVVDFDLYDLLLYGDKSKDAPLLPGDVIYIPPVGPQVAIAGSVKVPAIYELKGASTIADALKLAGGLSNTASDQKLRLERVDDHHMRSQMDVPITTAGEATPLQDGDILELTAIVDQFKDAVTLRGNVANPGRYAWKPGMRISDLIPNQESLITRDYWQRRSQLGQPALAYTPLVQSSAGEGQLPVGRGASRSRSTSENTSGLGGGGSGSSAEALLSSTSGTASFQPRNNVILSAPDIDWSYAVIERQGKKDLTTTLLPFNLGKLVMEGDQSQNLALQPGDVVTIFSKADIRVPQSQRTRYVRLEGEFVSAGIYSVRPGETLRQLVERAGGLTPEAYLYGSQFTRESTQRLQQQRLNDYANQLQLEAQSTAANAATNAVSTQDSAAASAMQQQAQAIVAQLRQVQATGRIVLDLPVNSQGAASLPDIPLEDGDRFIVPRVPSSIMVEGAVYNPNSFLYDPRMRVGDYLRLAGGANRDADKSRAFVIRADGSVISKQYSSMFRGGSFNSIRLYPGDTVVMPQSIDKRATLRNLLDISQVVGQFGLGAAAINVLK
ncbi:MAG: SLBB domain-containing protein [Acidobacteriaceae bacterium]